MEDYMEANSGLWLVLQSCRHPPSGFSSGCEAEVSQPRVHPTLTLPSWLRLQVLLGVPAERERREEGLHGELDLPHAQDLYGQKP